MSEIQNWMRSIFGGSGQKPVPHGVQTCEPAAPQGLAAQLYLDRRARETWFAKGLFREPAWDILLYMADAEESGSSGVSLKGLTKAPFSISAESVNRWVDLLIKTGYLETLGKLGTNGGPRVQMTSLARRSMARYLQAVATAA